MNLDPIKPIGAFVENTLRPLLDEMHWFFEACEKRGVPITEENVKSVLEYIARAHMRTCVVNLLQNMVVTLIICLTFFLLAK